MFHLKKPPLSVSVDIVRNRRSTEPDGVPQNLSQRGAEPAVFSCGDSIGSPSRANSRSEKALIGVDIAHSCQEGLIEQRRFNRKMPPSESGSERLCADLKWLGSGRFKSGDMRQLTKFEAPEPARIDKAQLTSTLEAQPRVRMFRNFALGSRDQQPSGHAEVHDPLRVGLGAQVFFRMFVYGARRRQLKHDVFSGAMYGENPAAFQAFRLLQRRSLEGLRILAEPSLGDAVPAHTLIRTARDRLNLRQFGHSLIVVG